ncbi:MAG: ClpX C4-type zinc finger protein [Cyanobacteria bacterium SZAS LIN-3]|nr:ClpX C4-type zinc finger protein [Cyanobacteria bacterium SZAS LIN-3]
MAAVDMVISTRIQPVIFPNAMFVPVEVLIEGEWSGMSELTCGWCGKNDEQVDTLIAGSDGNICNLCVAVCQRSFAEHTSSVSPGTKRPKCSFCEKEPWEHKARLVSGNGAHICQDCLEGCDEILNNVFWAGKNGEIDSASKSDVAEPQMPEREPQRRAGELTDSEQEWAQLVYEASDKKELLRRGTAWLRQNKASPAAGEAAAQLLAIKPNAGVVSIAEAWISQHPNHESVPILLGALIKAAPSPRSIRLAGQYIQSLSNLKKSEPIIKAAIASQNASLCRRIGQAMDKYPTGLIWLLSLHPYPAPRTKTSDKLFARWMQLNKHSQTAGMGFAPAISSRSPLVMEACFDWMRAGGLKNDSMPFILSSMIGRSKSYHNALFPGIVRFARKWLRANPDHEDAGRVHAALFFATRSKSDTKNAKQWYHQHQTNEHARLVISNLLEDAYRYGYKPEPFVVEQAKSWLREEKFRHKELLLLGALLGASADEETVAWAREAYSQFSPHSPLWILRRLLRRAPDAETIATAEREFARWKDQEDEPEMLYALLCADPGNSLAWRRVRLWKKRDPKNRFIRNLR